MFPSSAQSPCQQKESQKYLLIWGCHFPANKLVWFGDGGGLGPFARKGLVEVRWKTKTRPASPFLKAEPFRIHLDMSGHAGRQTQAQTGVTAGQLTCDFRGQRHRARQNMMCADILQCSCHIEHQWRSGGRWTGAAKYDILQKKKKTHPGLASSEPQKTRWSSRQRWRRPLRGRAHTFTGL